MPEGLPLFRGTKFYRDHAPAVLTTAYTVATSKTAQVVQIDVCNTDASARTITVKLGGFALFSALSLDAGETVTWQGLQVLTGGETIEVQASAADVVAVHISGSLSS